MQTILRMNSNLDKTCIILQFTLPLNIDLCPLLPTNILLKLHL